jgi:hypothetical protein
MVTVQSSAARVRHADRLLELYRREQERHWGAREMLDGLLECSEKMLAGTVAKCAAKLTRPNCSRAAVAKMAENVIREMVDRGHGDDIEVYIEGQATRRSVHERIRRGVLELDEEALEIVARVVDKLTERTN